MISFSIVFLMWVFQLNSFSYQLKSVSTIQFFFLSLEKSRSMDPLRQRRGRRLQYVGAMFVYSFLVQSLFFIVKIERDIHSYISRHREETRARIWKTNLTKGNEERQEKLVYGRNWTLYNVDTLITWNIGHTKFILIRVYSLVTIRFDFSTN